MEKANYMEHVGCRIAQRVTAALCGNGYKYDEISGIIYAECMDIANEQYNGDWIEMPNGDTYTKSFTVKKPL
jgi:hypothetical protein